MPLFQMPHAGLWPSAWWNGLATEEGANWIDAVVWYLKHDFVLLLHRTAVTACYFSLYQFWHLNIFSWKRMSFSWKNFIPGFAGSCNICYIYYYLLTPSPNPQCLASPFKSLSIPSPHLEVYLTINFYLKWSVWHIPHSNPQWPGKRKLESLEN